MGRIVGKTYPEIKPAPSVPRDEDVNAKQEKSDTQSRKGARKQKGDGV